MKRFKKILDYLLTIICWIIGIILVYQSFIAFFDADPWGLAFTFYLLYITIRNYRYSIYSGSYSVNQRIN